MFTVGPNFYKHSSATPDFSPTIWYDASVASSITKNGSNWVSQWNDISGNGINATHVAYPNVAYGSGAKFGGKPAVYFGGIDGDAVLNITGCPSSAVWTVISAMSWVSFGGYAGLGIRYDTDNALGLRHEFVGVPGLTDLANGLCRYDIDGAYRSASGTVSTGNHVLATQHTASANSGIVRLDGINVLSINNAAGAQSIPFASLGAGGPGTSYGANGNAIGEILVYNKVLTLPQIQLVEAYLKSKWGTI